MIDATLHRPREPALLSADAVKMRGDIAAHKPPAGALDVKLIEGGLIDAEFAVHLLQLSRKVGLAPDLAAAIAALEKAGLLAHGFGAAYCLLIRMLVTLRLVAPDSGEPAEASRPLVARACGQADWSALLLSYDAARQLIGGEWRRIAGLV